MSDFKDKLKNLPMSPGVYIMKDVDGTVIYVGKSKFLKNRVSQYFMHSKNHTPKTVAMVEHVADFDYILTDTEAEALVLECNLIKEYMPKYNILLKDGKQYPYIKITYADEYPRIYMTRRLVKDGSKYFGPYMSAFMVHDTLETIKKIFKVRSCSKNLPRDIGKTRPCLYYHINQCSAPCNNLISKDEYREVFDQISDVLDGKYKPLIKILTQKMQEASEKLEFERAARYRDNIENIKVLGEKQKIISTQQNNRDIIGIFKDDSDICIQIFYMRDGKTIGSEYFVFENRPDTVEEVLSGFLKQYYFVATNIPKEILLPNEIEDMEEISEWLSKKSGHKINVLVPKRGEKSHQVEMVNRNAEESLTKHKFKRDKKFVKQNKILTDLKNLLNLESPPFRIESYDISNISGADSIGVCVVYKNAVPCKKEYRKFNIKFVEGANDYESMREVIFRRISRAREEAEKIDNGTLDSQKAKFAELPNLILLDGGKGHVSVIRDLLEALEEEIPVYGLVKDDNHRTRGITNDKNEFLIDNDGELFKFLTCMQDEVHRFAIDAFRNKHTKKTINSELEKINGIGPAKRKKLLSVFKSIKNIKSASYNDLSGVVGSAAAKKVVEYFNSTGG